jgi:hypothetical protein
MLTVMQELPAKIRVVKVPMELNGTPQLLVHADDVNLLGDNIDTAKKNTQTLIDASKEVGLEVNPEKTKCMLLSRHQNSGQNHDIKIGNKCFENVAQFACSTNGGEEECI